eukprot:755241-Pelagomonas_calceolata.AAC.1
MDCPSQDLANLCTQFQHMFSPAPPRSVSRHRDFKFDFIISFGLPATDCCQHLYCLSACSARLGVKRSTCNWSVLRECGQGPLQFYWSQAAIRFFNSMLTSNSELVRKVLNADRALTAALGVECWTAEILESFNGLEKHEQYTQAVLTGKAINIETLLLICGVICVEEFGQR